jgi:hypothetical protein
MDEIPLLPDESHLPQLAADRFALRDLLAKHALTSAGLKRLTGWKVTRLNIAVCHEWFVFRGKQWRLTEEGKLC